MSKNIIIAYFSPTGNTKKSLEAMAEALGGYKEALDLTAAGQAVVREFTADDLVIFGVPVYGGRIPKAAKVRFEQLKGNQTPCLAVVTYGNRDFDDALLELADMAAEQGFVVKGAAALVGRHTYGEIQVNRPDEEDLKADREFAKKALENLNKDVEFVIPGNRPYKDGGNGGRFRPLTADSCVHCGVCADACPVQAIAEDHTTIGDGCISCFRCIRQCPVGAKNMNTDAYNEFAVSFTERLKVRRENQFFC